LSLAGRLSLEVGGELVIDEGQFRGRQGRLAFAYLVCERTHPVRREDLAEVLWPGETRTAWEADLSALVSRLRGLLARTTPNPKELFISGGSGNYQIPLPPDTWVDLEAAALTIDDAEGALRAGDPRRAWGPANVAVAVARRPFLSGEQGEWVESQRRKLERQLLGSLACLGKLWLSTQEAGPAVAATTQA